MLQLGVILILLGLLLGFAIPFLTNPRMGLSSHLEGLQNGVLLVAIGLVWPKLKLSEGLLRLTYCLTLFGTYTNVFATLLSAAWGTSRMTPLAGQGHVGTPSQEAIVRALLVSLSLAMVAACLLLAAGLRGQFDESREHG